MRSNDINDLIQSDSAAKAYFDSLSSELKSGLMAHGSGINNLEELKHFAGIMEIHGGRPYK